MPDRRVGKIRQQFHKWGLWVASLPLAASIHVMVLHNYNKTFFQKQFSIYTATANGEYGQRVEAL